MSKQNRILMFRKGETIEILINATSEESAQKIYEVIELALTRLQELDWQESQQDNNDGGDRDGER